jgi:hypothetical protein
LSEGISFSVEQDADDVSLMLTSAAPYSSFLRDGTKNMDPRDFFGQEALDRYLPIIADGVQTFINNRSDL